MQLRVLGPVDARADGRSLALGGAKQRAVLAMLGLEANRTVSADHLIEGLWGEQPPASAAKMLQNYVWRLRGVLGAGAGAEIITRGRDYELRIDPESVDFCRVERLLREATRAAEAGEPVDAAREALALWRGPALSDVADQPFAAPAIGRLDELRLEAAELAIDADLAAGRHHEVAGEINALVVEDPLRERFHAQRMLALYRCDRQAEALAAYRDARRTLVDEIGVEPGPQLQDLHEAMLGQDRSLDVEAAAPELPRELDAISSPPLAGRDEELSWLRAHWQRARRGAGALVALLGAHGMGKSRLAAEIAGEAHRGGASVLYVAGKGSAEAAVTAIARTRESRRPTLLVIDDADRADADVRAAIRALGDELATRGSLVVATGQEAAALTRLRPSASLALEPLDAAAVRQIGLLYAPAGAAGEIPVETLRESSRGVTRRVHEVASEWARREAARRVDAVAGRAAAGRTRARALEFDLAGSVIDLQSARERVELLAAPESEGPVTCPYKGLATFDVEDAEFFFGREQLVAELVARLAGAPLLAVVGPSGSGKSSALRAGLLPALAGGVLPGSERWARVLIRPGEQPMRELREAASGRGEHGRTVLAVDQFEETFTACRDTRQRDAFIAALVDAARDREGRNVVVLAVRADFYGRCGAYPELSRLLGANTVLVGPMSRDELRRAITLPAERVGLRVEADLKDRLVADVDAQPGALPLLSTTLLELWQQRRGRRLQLAAYAQTGGVHSAVARLAEDAFGRLEPTQQEAARNVLLRLAGEGEAGAIVRRRVPLAELEAPRSDDVAHVVAIFTNRRLLTVSAGTVEVAHEALLREWPRLRGWLDEDGKGRRLHRQLADAAREWDERGRDPGELYGGARLALALEWRAGHAHELNSTERAFLDASRAAAGRAQRRLRLALAGVAALLVIAALGAVIALHQRSTAQMQARAAQAQRLGIQALTETDLDRSLLLARQGVALDDSPATRSNLITALLRAPAALGVIRGTGHPLVALDLSPSGRTLAVGDSRGTVLFYDVVTRRRIGPPYTRSGEITALRFSNDGRRLAVIGSDLPETPAVDLVDARTHRIVRELFRDPDLDPGPNLGNAVFSSDSRVVAAAFAAIAPGSRNRQYIQRWNALTGDRLGPPRSISAGALVGFIAGNMLPVTAGAAGRETDVRDATTLRLIRRWRDGGAPASVSPDGSTFAYGARDGSVQLVDLRTGELRAAAGGHGAPVTTLRFAPNSRALVSAAADGRLIVWDAKRGTRSETLENPSGPVSQLTIARNGRTALTAGQNGSVIAWDLSGKRRLGRRFRVPTQNARSFYGQALAPDVAVSPDGETFVIPERTGYADLFDSQTLARIARIRLRPGAHLITGAIAPDGQTMVAATLDGDLVFADLRTHRPLGPPIPADNPPAVGLAFSADGRWLATNSGDTLAIWDARRRTFVRQVVLGTWATATDVSLSPDGTTLTATVHKHNVSGGLDIVRVPRLSSTRHVPAPLGDWGRYSRDGRLLLYGDRAGRAWLFDTRTWRPRGKPLIGHNSPVLTVNLSPNGQTLATTSRDGTARLWDVASGRAIGPTLPGVPDHPVSGAFVNGGRGLVTVYDNGRGYLWDVRPESWARQACEIAGRTLTHDEWRDVLPERDYAPACANP